MRTTVILNDELLRSAKKRAADEGTTLKAVLEQALRAYLGPPAPPRPFKLRLPPAHKGKPRPGVRIDDTKSLIEIMEGRA